MLLGWLRSPSKHGRNEIDNVTYLVGTNSFEVLETDVMIDKFLMPHIIPTSCFGGPTYHEHHTHLTKIRRILSVEENSPAVHEVGTRCHLGPRTFKVISVGP